MFCSSIWFFSDGFDLGGGVIPTSWAKDLEKLKTKAKQSEEILERVQLTDDLKSMRYY